MISFLKVGATVIDVYHIKMAGRRLMYSVIVLVNKAMTFNILVSRPLFCNTCHAGGQFLLLTSRNLLHIMLYTCITLLDGSRNLLFTYQEEPKRSASHHRHSSNVRLSFSADPRKPLNFVSLWGCGL